MAPRLPDRYEIQVRLGRDGDVEEWLATDRSLDRPVLVRILESSADTVRRGEFLASVRAAAAAHHVGLSEVYAVGTPDNPYSVLEWHGGVSLGDRLRAGETVDVTAFLEQGPKLAAALAALHDSGAIHGAIDPAAIGFAGNQPAKLGAFGRRARYDSPGDDTAALAATLRTAVTGEDIPEIRPSHVAEGLPPAVDTIIADAEDGRLGAGTLAAQLRALPPFQPARTRSTWSWRWSIVGAVLVVLALAISAVGATIDVDPESPFLFPAVPEGESRSTRPTLTALPLQAPSLPAEVAPLEPAEFPDVDSLTALLDTSGSTRWSTGDYFEQLDPSEPGLAIGFTLDGVAARAELSGSAGTGYRLLWSPDDGEEATAETVWTGTLLEGTNVARLPVRRGGLWVLELTRLPEIADGRFAAELSTVRFLE